MKREEWVDEITETIQELWAGEVPLRPAFWIYGFAVVLGFKWAMRAMAMPTTQWCGVIRDW